MRTIPVHGHEIPVEKWVYVAREASHVNGLSAQETYEQYILGLYFEVLGGQNIERHILHEQTEYGWRVVRQVLIISDTPFGVLEHDVRQRDPRFRFSRQRGGQGRLPPFGQRPELVQQAPQHGARTQAWTQLTELAKLVGLEGSDLLVRFFDMTVCKDGLPIVLADGPHEIQGQQPDVQYLSYAAEIMKYGSGLRFNSLKKRIWVTQGFAQTVLRCHQLGYIPLAPDDSPGAPALY